MILAHSGGIRPGIPGASMFLGLRTQLINALRGHLAEFGLIVAQGSANLKDMAGMAEAGILAQCVSAWCVGERKISSRT